MGIYNHIGASARSVQDGWMVFFRSLASQHGIKFVWGGRPATDGKTVWLPRLPLDLNREDMMLVKKHGYHEIGHILFTDFSYFVAFGHKYGSTMQGWLNAIEDPWMEGKTARRMRVAVRYFREAPKVYQTRGMMRTGENNIADAFGGFLLCKSHLVINKWLEFEAPLAECRANFVRQFGEEAEDLLDLVERIIENEAPSCTSTEENGNLTLRIIDALKQHAEDQDNDQQDEGDDQDESCDETSGDTDSDENESNDKSEGGANGADEDDSESDSEGGANGADDDDTDSGSEQDESDPSQDGDDQGSESESSTGDEDPNSPSGDDGDSDPDSGTTGSGTGEPSLMEKVEALLNSMGSEGEVMDGEEILQQLAQEIESGQSVNYSAESLNAVPESGEFDPGAGAGQGDYVDGIAVVSDDHDAAAAIKESIGNSAQVLSGMLQQLLLSTQEEDTLLGRRGKLMGTELYRIPMGNTNIFGMTEEVESDVANVSVLADMSASTHWSNCGEVLRQGLMLFNDVLEAIQADYELLGFGPDQGNAVTLIKGFSESSATAKARIGGMASDTGSGTPLLEGLIEAGIRLTEQAGNRQVMFVMTDGDPFDIEACAENSLRLQAEGIEIVYLLMGTNVSTGWLEAAQLNYIHVKEFEALIPAMMNELRRILT